MSGCRISKVGSIKDWTGRVLLVGVALAAVACGDDGSFSPDGGGAGGVDAGGLEAGERACPVVPAAMWSAPGWAENAQTPLALRDRLAALTGDAFMRGGETGAVALTKPDLMAAYEVGEPSLAAVSSMYLHHLVGDAFDELLTAVAAGPRDLVDASGQWAPGPQGGIWSTRNRAFNQGGIEVRMIPNMGTFGAGFYNYALGLTTGPIVDGTIDALAAAFGANPGINPGRSDDPVADNQNRNSANYVYRMGFYGSARQALIAAKAYAASADCVAQRDVALRAFFRAWEQGLFARFLYYSNAGARGVANAADHEALAAALHEQAEGIGLAIGFFQLPDPVAGPLRGAARVMTDAQIAQALAALRVDVAAPLAAARLGTFVSDPLGYAAAVRAAESVVAAAFALGEAELAAYRTPTDG